MITIEPHGSISLCRTPLEADYKNQLTFANATKQLEYFISVTVESVTDYTYIRKDNQIKVSLPIDTIINCNYLYYNNGGFTSKIYYCFITKMEYINENTTLISFQTDCFQTYQFDIVYNNCFVEREHVNDDTIGKHTVPEGLETGEYVVNQKDKFVMSRDIYVCFAVTKVPDGSGVGLNLTYPNHHRYNNVFSGFAYLVTTYDNASNLINAYDLFGGGDNIKEIFIVPKELVDYHVTWKLVSGYTYNFQYGELTDFTSANSFSSNSVTKKNTILTYTPKNNKLLVWPYVYGLIDNNYGTAIDFKLEDINANVIELNIESAISPGCEIKCQLESYKNVDANNIYSFTLGKYPICSWANNEYINWLKQNSMNIGLGLVTDLGQMAIGAGQATIAPTPLSTVSGINKMVSGVTGIANTLTKVYEHSFIAPSLKGNINTSNLNYAIDLISPLCYQMCIKEEYAKIIDNYFSMFGYKVNTVKIPNITGRTNWNYIKTIDCNFDGNIPQDDLKIIKSMFDNGVTMWHNPNTFYDYSQSNAIV